MIIAEGETAATLRRQLIDMGGRTAEASGASRREREAAAGGPRAGWDDRRGRPGVMPSRSMRPQDGGVVRAWCRRRCGRSPKVSKPDRMASSAASRAKPLALPAFRQAPADLDAGREGQVAGGGHEAAEADQEAARRAPRGPSGPSRYSANCSLGAVDHGIGLFARQRRQVAIDRGLAVDGEERLAVLGPPGPHHEALGGEGDGVHWRRFGLDCLELLGLLR